MRTLGMMKEWMQLNASDLKGLEQYGGHRSGSSFSACFGCLKRARVQCFLAPGGHVCPVGELVWISQGRK